MDFSYFKDFFMSQTGLVGGVEIDKASVVTVTET